MDAEQEQDLLDKGPGGRPRTLIFVADIGPNQSLDRVVDMLSDLQVIVRAAERWGLKSQYGPNSSFSKVDLGGPDVDKTFRSAREELDTAFTLLGEQLEQLAQLAHLQQLEMQRHLAPDEAAQQLREFRERLIFSELTRGMPLPRADTDPSVTVTSVTYRNPLEVWLVAAGPAFVALHSLLALVRDWSSKRRKGLAEAVQAESQAALARTEAEFVAHLFDEMKAGRLDLDPQDLLPYIGDRELKAVRDLSRNPVTLELPETDEPVPKDSSQPPRSG